MICLKSDEMISNCELLHRMRDRNEELDRLMRLHFTADCLVGDFVKAVVATASHQLQVQRASIWLYTDDAHEIICYALYDAEQDEFTDYRTVPNLQQAAFPAYFQAMRETRVIDASEAASDPRTSEFAETYLKPLGITSMLDAQIPSSDSVKGVFCCESTSGARRWTPDEIYFLAALSGLVGQAFERQERDALLSQLHHALEQESEHHAPLLSASA